MAFIHPANPLMVTAIDSESNKKHIIFMLSHRKIKIPRNVNVLIDSGFAKTEDVKKGDRILAWGVDFPKKLSYTIDNTGVKSRSVPIQGENNGKRNVKAFG